MAISEFACPRCGTTVATTPGRSAHCDGCGQIVTAGTIPPPPRQTAPDAPPIEMPPVTGDARPIEAPPVAAPAAPPTTPPASTVDAPIPPVAGPIRHEEPELANAVILPSPLSGSGRPQLDGPQEADVAAMDGLSTHFPTTEEGTALPEPAADDVADFASIHVENPAEKPAGNETDRPLRRLSPEEKAVRRARMNVIMLALGFTVLVATLALLLYLTGG